MASLSDGDYNRLQRNIGEIVALAHLFSTNFCVLLCGAVDDGFLDGLQAHVTKTEDSFLVFALRLHECTSQHQHHSFQHDTKDRYYVKVPYFKTADLGPLQLPIDRALKVFSVASYACPCLAGRQTTPEMTSMSMPESISRLDAANKAKEPFLLATEGGEGEARVVPSPSLGGCSRRGVQQYSRPGTGTPPSSSSYKGVPLQTALSVCLAERQQGYRAIV